MYLRLDILSNAGTIQCCAHALFACLPAKCQCCRLYASICINIVDMSDYHSVNRSFQNITPIDSRLLQQPITREMLSHDPYTPESIDSHSPFSEKVVVTEDEARRNSVSPTQLKTRLESIMRLDPRKSPGVMKRSASENADVLRPVEHFFRTRAMSEVPKTRPKLISVTSAGSLHRLQSHHSSSDEDWFEFENESPHKSLEECLEEPEEISRDVPIIKEESKGNKRCRFKIEGIRKHEKLVCCCAVM